MVANEILIEAIKDVTAHPARDDFDLRDVLQRSAASALSRLLQDLLTDDGTWDSGAWIDDLLVDRAGIDRHGRIEAFGFIIYGRGGTTQQWLAPLSATLFVSSDGELAYRIGFDDTGQPHCEYPKRPRRPFDADTAWRYRFERGFP
jgi:hypothetical protein